MFSSISDFSVTMLGVCSVWRPGALSITSRVCLFSSQTSSSLGPGSDLARRKMVEKIIWGRWGQASYIKVSNCAKWSDLVDVLRYKFGPFGVKCSESGTFSTQTFSVCTKICTTFFLSFLIPPSPPHHVCLQKAFSLPHTGSKRSKPLRARAG